VQSVSFTALKSSARRAQTAQAICLRLLDPHGASAVGAASVAVGPGLREGGDLADHGAFSYQINDPKKQVAILKLANWWMRLAEHYVINKSSKAT
jgi:hypothetical protein